jgi:hypothetical protein
MFRVASVPPNSNTVAAILRSIEPTGRRTARSISKRSIQASLNGKTRMSDNASTHEASCSHARAIFAFDLACRRMVFQPMSGSSTVMTLMAKSSESCRATFSQTIACPR